MSAVFKRRVFFGMILLAMVLGVLFTTVGYFGLVWISKGTIDMQAMQDLESSMTPAGGVLLMLFNFMLQVLILTFIVPDQNMELIAGWKWAVVLVLQFVVIALIVIAVAFLLGSIGASAQTSQILTRVV
ncbi:MAG: hypothetical protein ABJF50_15305 [Paracoccaceae bacterium]